MSTLLEETAKSLQRIQTFEPEKLARTAELGTDLNFSEALGPAKMAIDLFSQIPESYLSIFPETWLQQLKSCADSFFNILDASMKFKASMDNAVGNRTALIEQISQAYNSFFLQISPMISYVSSRQKDYGALEREARAKIQQASDRADELAAVLSAHEIEAKRILEEVKKVAAEQGVSQQAIYFQTESTNHNSHATIWQWRTIYVGIALIAYSVLSVFVHKIPYLTPSNTYESIQLAVSKSLIFAVFAYFLILCARNFLSHTHNSIVNKHRQNALLTFKSLADAADKNENRDVVLTYAAACIFSPQETGYTKGNAQNSFGSVIEAIPRVLSSTSQPH